MVLKSLKAARRATKNLCGEGGGASPRGKLWLRVIMAKRGEKSSVGGKNQNEKRERGARPCGERGTRLKSGGKRQREAKN